MVCDKIEILPFRGYTTNVWVTGTLPSTLTEQILSECGITLAEIFELLDLARQIEKEELLTLNEVSLAIKEY